MAAMWHLKLDGMNYGLLLVATHYKKGRKKNRLAQVPSFWERRKIIERERETKREREREKKKTLFWR